MIKVLNLYAGIGGNRKLWPDYICPCGYSFEYDLGKYGCPNCEGDNIAKLVQVTAVELDPEIAKIYQDFFPNDTVIVGDAHQYLLDHYKEFDFIWASPPCQTHSKMRFLASKRGDYDVKMPDLGLYEYIIFMKHFCENKWIVENVDPYYDELIAPTVVLDRHLIWANFKIKPLFFDKPKVKHNAVTGKTERYGVSLSNYKTKHRKDQIIRNMVDPELGLHIFNQALERMDVRDYKQKDLFI